MGAWEDQLAQWGGPDWMAGAAGGFALDYLDAPPPMETGIHALDELVGGLPRGEVAILAGDAGMGKTALACQLAYHAAMRGERPVYCSFEMSRLKCLMRMVACHAALHPELLGGLGEVRWSGSRPHPDALAQVRQIREECGGDQALADARVAQYAAAYGRQIPGVPQDPAMLAWHDMDESMRGAGGILVADSMRSLADVESCVTACAEGGSRLVVIDYAQLVDTGEEKEYDRMATLSGGLRRLAKDTRVAMLVISALRKLSGGDRKDGPAMDWLKGNNALAYDAGQVLFLLRPDGEDGEPGPVRDVDLAVVKNRNGKSGGRCELAYDAPRNLVTSRWLPSGAKDTIGLWT